MEKMSTNGVDDTSAVEGSDSDSGSGWGYGWETITNDSAVFS